MTVDLEKDRVVVEREDGCAVYAMGTAEAFNTGIHWQPGHWFTLLKDCRRGDLSVTDRVGHEVLSLPLHSMMPAETLDRVVQAAASFNW